MFKLETDNVHQAVSVAISGVYNGSDELTEIKLQLSAIEALIEYNRAYVVRVEGEYGTCFNVFAFFSEVNDYTTAAPSSVVYEIDKFDYVYKVACITDMFN